MAISTFVSTTTLFSAKRASAWATSSLEGVVPHPLKRAAALNPLEMGEAATREEPKPRNKERAAVNMLGR